MYCSLGDRRGARRRLKSGAERRAFSMTVSFERSGNQSRLPAGVVSAIHGLQCATTAEFSRAKRLTVEVIVGVEEKEKEEVARLGRISFNWYSATPYRL